ncbi:MAG: Transcriptional regulator, LysR family [Moraxellaceae bacterium]|jgi:DNA-binding transcriptional LysR family regulator|nr:Transcriptional regulator, LysR family [Moraxellaceae bacterium]
MASLDDMVLFAAVVRAGSFTAAARALGQPLSSVSRRVQQLEAALGTRLLERTTRSLRMTEAGQVFFQHCQQLATQAEDAERALQRLRQEPSGHLRMALPFSVDDSWATAVLSTFLGKYPKISLEAILLPGGVDPDDDTMDVLFAYGARPETHHPVIPLGTPHIGLFASPRYLQRAGVPQSPEDLPQHDMVRLTTLPMEVYSPAALQGLDLNYRMITNELLMARLTCIDGLGIGWLPLISCLRFVKQGALVPLMPELHFALPIWLIYRSASRSMPKVALLAEHLMGLLGTQGAWDALEKGQGW